MAVYIDTYNAKYGRMTMCHMMADTEQELDQMADAIGVARRWKQLSKIRAPHYDVCLAKKKLALSLGAVEVTPIELVKRFPSLVMKNKEPRS